MNLWRLEYLRIRRSWRGVAVLVVFLLFGLLGPLTAEYLGEIVNQFGSDDIQIIVPEPTPVDGLAQYLGNVHQIGLIVAIAVTTSALAFDANTDVAIFLRTRISSIRRLVLIRSTVYVALSSGAFALGAIAAWYETAILIGTPPTSAMLVGMALGVGYYTFVVALVALAAALTRSALAATAIAFGAALAEQIAWSIVPSLDRWLPSRLAFAITDLIEDNDPLDYLPTVAITIALSAAIGATATRLLDRREV